MTHWLTYGIFFCDIIRSGATVSALRLCQRLVALALSVLATDVFILLFICSLPSRQCTTLFARNTGLTVDWGENINERNSMAALHEGNVYLKMDECDAVDSKRGGWGRNPVWTYAKICDTMFKMRDQEFKQIFDQCAPRQQKCYLSLTFCFYRMLLKNGSNMQVFVSFELLMMCVLWQWS